MMNEVGVVTAKKHPLLPRWLKFLLMLLGFLLAVAALLWVIADISTRDALEAEIADLRAKGWPTTLEELMHSEIPPEENAAAIYEQAFLQLIDLDEKGYELLWKLDEPEECGPIDEEGLAYLEECLRENGKALELLHQAAQMPRCHFNLVLPTRPWVDTSLAAEWRGAVRLTDLAARVAIKKGNGEDALRRWQDSVAVSHALVGHPLLIVDLVRTTCAWMSLDALEALLQSGLLGETQLRQALETLDGLEARSSLACTMQGELAYRLTTLDDTGMPLGAHAALKRAFGQPLSVMDRFAEWGGWLSGTWLARPLRQYDQQHLVEFLGKLAPLSEQAFYEGEDERKQLEAEADQRLGWLPLSGLESSLFLRALPLQAAHEARVASARAAVALEIYRKRHGEYPDTLNALVPSILAELPVDPFDGRPLRYVKAPERVVVYSVGENLQDDGGQDQLQPGSYGLPPDIVVTLRRAPGPTEEADDE